MRAGGRFASGTLHEAGGAAAGKIGPKTGGRPRRTAPLGSWTCLLKTLCGQANSLKTVTSVGGRTAQAGALAFAVGATLSVQQDDEMPTAIQEERGADGRMDAAGDLLL